MGSWPESPAAASAVLPAAAAEVHFDPWTEGGRTRFITDASQSHDILQCQILSQSSPSQSHGSSSQQIAPSQFSAPKSSVQPTSSSKSQPTGASKPSASKQQVPPQCPHLGLSEAQPTDTQSSRRLAEEAGTSSLGGLEAEAPSDPQPPTGSVPKDASPQASQSAPQGRPSLQPSEPAPCSSSSEQTSSTKLDGKKKQENIKISEPQGWNP